MWAEYIEQRKKQRAKEEEDLRKLKERQAKRKAQRAEQEKMMFEMKRKQEEQKQREIVSAKIDSFVYIPTLSHKYWNPKVKIPYQVKRKRNMGQF